ncbi:bombesin receptor-activated protein C6orf89 homolog [Branchiostoma lanceolatum]|uniref:bombesin receptor-activated protein C6orf89 homolog n=1 Tax=Branchiostoma lanceolatum TaxID=7740 RepID=UPI0034522363
MPRNEETKEPEYVYEKVSDSFHSLRKKGKDWGLSDEVIEKCIHQALESGGRSGEGGRPVRSSCGQCLATFLKVMFVIGFVLVLGTVFVTYHDPTARRVAKATQDWAYPMLRASRMLTLPLTKWFNLEAYYEYECLVPNFLQPAKQPNCWMYKKVKGVPSIRRAKNFTDAYYGTAKPVIIKDAQEKEVDFSVLQSVYKQHKDSLDSGVKDFHSSNPDIQTLADVFNVQTAEDMPEQTSIMWMSRKVVAGSVIRKLFPRPYIIEPESEVGLAKYIFIDTPGAPARNAAKDMGSADYPHTWLTQGTGTREVWLKPVADCAQKQDEIIVILYPRDVLYYNYYYWQPEFHHHGDNISITFSGSFY